MNLHNVQKDLRENLREVLQLRGLSQVEFAQNHGLSYSWINKFLNEAADNARIDTLTDLQAAIEKERSRVPA